QFAAEENASRRCLSQSPATTSGASNASTRSVQHPHPGARSLAESSDRDLRAPKARVLRRPSVSALRASAGICLGSTNRCRADQRVLGGLGMRRASDARSPLCWLPKGTLVETFDIRRRTLAPLCPEQ